MHYTQFIKGLDHYYDNYCLGLKKQANQALKQFLCDFDKLAPTLSTQLLEQLCFQLYEQKAPAVKKLLDRGNGNLPYELSLRVQHYLEAACKQQQMPQLRWYYEFDQGDFGLKALEMAYHHHQCDTRTIQLWFHHYLHILDWGAHHFPTCCLLKQADYNDIEIQCLKMCRQHTIDPVLKAEFSALQQQYHLWWQYLQTTQAEDFTSYCLTRGVVLAPSVCIYYQK